MTDPRPSENDRPEFPEMRRRFGDAHTYPAPKPVDPLMDMVRRAENANLPEHGLVYAQLATVKAIQAQTEQQRIANIIAWTTRDDLKPNPSVRQFIEKGLGL